MRITKSLILGLACCAAVTFAGCSESSSSDSPNIDENAVLYNMNNFSKNYTANLLVSNTADDNQTLTLKSSQKTSVKSSSKAENIGTDEETTVRCASSLLENINKGIIEETAAAARADGKLDFKVNTKYTDCPVNSLIQINALENLRTPVTVNVRKLVDNNEVSGALVFAQVKSDGKTVITKEQALEMDKFFSENNSYAEGNAPIAETVRNTFGKEFSPGLDGTDKIIFIVLDNNTIGNGVYGYFNGIDEYPVSQSSRSNEGEILYLNGSASSYDLYSTIAHEFQHMCSFNQKAALNGEYTGQTELLSINEGRSVLAEDLCGFKLAGKDGTCNGFILKGAVNYLNAPEKVSFDEFNNVQAQYGANYLLQRYIADNYGIGAVTKAATNQTTGLENVGAGAGKSFKNIFSEFGIANACSNMTDSKYNYKSISLNRGYGAAKQKLGYAKAYPVSVAAAPSSAKFTTSPYTNSYYSFNYTVSYPNLMISASAPKATNIFSLIVTENGDLKKIF